MALFKCKMCGGDLEISEGVTIAECEYCGTKQTVPTARDENMQALFNRANTLRIKSEFDKAEKLYEKIIQADPTQTEAYWGLILCKYGIEYVDDPATFKKVPTCHRASFESIVADDDYKSALKYADMSQRAIYEEQAKEIDRIQKDILALAQKEETYDVFICYKETDANGQRTQDSVIANDIYYQLTNEGFKVFYSAITLEGKLGSAYEPIIFAALNSAKVMLAIGTKPEHFNAVWVKNEWSRYLKITKKDRSKLLIPCYRDMDAYELPDEFAHLQAQDMAKIGFINDIVRGIKKVIKKDEPKVAPTKANTVKETVVASGNIAPLLKRTFMFLEDGEFDRADALCEQVLNQDPENAQAYVAKLMVELRVKKLEDLKDCENPFDDNNNYKKAIRFGDENLKTEFKGYIEHIKTRNENARLEGIYKQAVQTMRSACDERSYKKAAEMFNTISSYKNSTSLAKDCIQKAQLEKEKVEAARKDKVLTEAKFKMASNSIIAYDVAIKMFESIPGWKDADELRQVCQQKKEELAAQYIAQRERSKNIIVTVALILCAIIVIGAALYPVLKHFADLEEQYQSALRNMNSGNYTTALTTFNKLNEYKDSEDKVAECRQLIQYFEAMDLMENGDYQQAKPIFESLNGFKDSNNRIIECQTGILGIKYDAAFALIEENKVKEAISAFEELGDYKDAVLISAALKDEVFLMEARKNTIQVGGSFPFGTYEQDNDTTNGAEPIEWLVLAIEDNKALVISLYALDSKPYKTQENITTWETSFLRTWLNKDFYNTAFALEEKAMIPFVTVQADKNPEYDTIVGADTQDRIFLLSAIEAENKYFRSPSERLCRATDYAISQGVDALNNNRNCVWWLRTTGRHETNAVCINLNGQIYADGNVVTRSGIGVRPAMWIDLTPLD